MVTKSKLIILLFVNLYCSQLLDNAEGPLDFLPQAGLLRSSTPPKVMYSNPGEGAVGVSPNTDVRVMFSDSMNLVYTQSSFSMIRDGASVEGSFSWIDKLMIFTPFRQLTDPGLYTYSISKARAENTNGANLIDDYKVSFSYSTDLVKPRVTQILPQNGASGVSPNTLITVQFDKSMDRLPVLGAFSLSPSVDIDLVNTIVSNGDKTFQFLPRFPLNFGTVYQIQIAESAKDTSGNAINQSVSSVFTVGDDLTLPSLTAISTNSVTDFLNQEVVIIDGVNRNDSILLTFSEPIQPLSLSSGIQLSPSPSFNIIQISPIQFEIRFNTSLNPSTVYTLTVADSVLDFQNNRLSKSYTYNLRTQGTQTQKIQLQGFFSDAGFSTNLFEDRVNVSSPQLTNCPALDNECNQNLFIKFCYGETRASCIDTLSVNSQILLSSLRLTITRTFGQSIGSCQEYFTNPINATPGALAPSITAFSTTAVCLDRGSTYTITVRGGSTGVKDNFGNIMDLDQSVIVRFP